MLKVVDHFLILFPAEILCDPGKFNPGVVRLKWTNSHKGLCIACFWINFGTLNTEFQNTEELHR